MTRLLKCSKKFIGVLYISNVNKTAIVRKEFGTDVKEIIISLYLPG